MAYTVTSRALTGEKPCINKGFLVLLMHRKLTFNMIAPGPLKLFRHILYNCHNTINWWSNRSIKRAHSKKKDARTGFWTLFFCVRVCYSIHYAREPLVLQCGTIASNTHHYFTSIDKVCHHIFVYTSSCRETELKRILSSYFYDVKLRVKQLWKKTCSKISASKNCKMAQEWIRLIQHGNYCI